MTFRRLLPLLAATSGFITLGTTAQAADPEAIVSSMFALSGNHAKVRASGAKGICLSGSFTPAPEAADLSKAPQFASRLR
jgi:catalase